jgi:tetratricopeptide (TPR) repeat protein
VTTKSQDITLRIEQRTQDSAHHSISLELERPGESRLKASAEIEFALTPQEHAELKWYLEDYLHRAESVTEEHVQQIESMMCDRGIELFEKILEGNREAQRIFDRVVDDIADLRVEITTSVADAAAIPWELMRDPSLDSAIALRVKSFVRVQSEANLSFVKAPDTDELGRVRLLYVVCRPSGTDDVALRAVVNQLLQGLGDDLECFDITALRPPTYEQLQKKLTNAREAGRPYHIVHFDGHGVYADLENLILADWAKALSHLMLGADSKGKHGFLLFEHPDSEDKMRPVSGDQLGKLLHDSGVPVLVLNACQSAMHEATDRPENTQNVHDEVRAIGSLSQAVVDQGIPAVLGMRYSVFVVTAAQYIGRVYSALAKGRSFGQAATEGRKDLHENPERWVGLQPRPLQDWFVPVVFEAARLQLFPDRRTDHAEKLREKSRAAAALRDPIQNGSIDVKYVPDTGFIGRDETLLLLDRAFDAHSVVLLHAYAGQGKTTTAVEFARWYATTGGLGARPNVLLTSFETTNTLPKMLDTIGQRHVDDWSAINQLEERRQRVLAVLRSVPLLWIWDNVEPVAGFPAGTESGWTNEEQRELADFLKRIKLDPQSKAKVLLTSRRDEQTWLSGIPYRIPMPRMRRSDAARLAQQLGAERNLTRSEINSWQPLLDYCAGNPLTLRVIAGQAVRMGLRGEDQITAFVQAVRDGEQQIEDADEAQGRDVSLGASLDYGFKNAFNEEELPIIALLHLFQGVVDVRVLQMMGALKEHALPELAGRSKEQLTGLLERCRETGLLTHLCSTWYTIHPALPWFLRQLFAKHYPDVGRTEADANAGTAQTEVNPFDPSTDDEHTRSSVDVPADSRFARSGLPSTATAAAAIRAWVKAVGNWSDYYQHHFDRGRGDMIHALALEESNLLHVRRVSRRHGWWSPVTSVMQGLYVLYEYQGRMTEWSRLVTEIVPDYCTGDDSPIPGREDDYSLVIGYRVNLAQTYDHDLPKAAALQEKQVAWCRRQAAPVLAMPPKTPLDARQRNVIHNLGASMTILAQIIGEQSSGDCIELLEECVLVYQRIGDANEEAITQYNIGNAYLDIADIRDLAAAETAYQRSLDLTDKNDAKGRSVSIKQIGMVHHERLREARAVSESTETVQRHAQNAELHYIQALALCPTDAVTNLGPIYYALGVFYLDVGQSGQARENFEKRIQLAELSGNGMDAGVTRFNLALTYGQFAEHETTMSGRETLLRRAQTYAAAALRDFQHYDGRAADWGVKCQRLLDRIQQQLS